MPFLSEKTELLKNHFNIFFISVDILLWFHPRSLERKPLQKGKLFVNPRSISLIMMSSDKYKLLLAENYFVFKSTAFIWHQLKISANLSSKMNIWTTRDIISKNEWRIRQGRNNDIDSRMYLFYLRAKIRSILTDAPVRRGCQTTSIPQKNPSVDGLDKSFVSKQIVRLSRRGRAGPSWKMARLIIQST